MDVFENDGFAVDDAEDDEEEEGGNTKQAQNKKKKKRKSLKNIVLDDEDLELIRENKSFNQETLIDGKFKKLRKAGVDSELMEYSSDDRVSLFDDIAEDQTNDDVEDDMADFIVDDEDVIYGMGDSLSYFHILSFF